MIKTIEWTDEGIVMIDQRRLPAEELYPVFKTHEEVAQAIEEMVVRGAPAIGVAAARVGLSDALALAATSYGLCLVALLFLPETRGKHLSG